MSSSAMRPSSRTGALRRRARRARQTPVAAVAGDDDLHAWMGVGQSGGGPHQRVHALAGNQPRHAGDGRRLRRQAQPGPGRRLVSSAKGSEAGGVHPRGDHEGAQRPACGPLALGGRVIPGGDHPCGPSQHPGQQRPAQRQPPRHGHLGAVGHDRVGDAPAAARSAPRAPPGRSPRARRRGSPRCGSRDAPGEARAAATARGSGSPRKAAMRRRIGRLHEASCTRRTRRRAGAATTPTGSSGCRPPWVGSRW